jgi:hypothetical protein
LSALEQFAGKRGLEYRPTGSLEGQFPILRWGDDRHLEGLARGPLTEGHEGTLGGLICVKQPADGPDQRIPFLVVLCGLPGSAGTFPLLEVRSREADLSDGPAALTAGLGTVRLESEFFETRFTLLVGPGTDTNAVLRLFAPKFLDWYAYEAPYALCLALRGGRLCVYAPAEFERPGRIDSIWDAAARIAAEVSRESPEAA